MAHLDGTRSRWHDTTKIQWYLPNVFGSPFCSIINTYTTYVCFWFEALRQMSTSVVEVWQPEDGEPMVPVQVTIIYFCSWKLPIDVASAPFLTITRLHLHVHGQCSPHCCVLDPALQCNVLFMCDPHADLTFTCLDINTTSKKLTIMVLVDREANVVHIQGGRKVAISPPFSHHVARCFLICTSCPFWKCALCSIQYFLEKC